MKTADSLDSSSVDPTRGECRRLVALAGPSLVTGLGCMGMGVVDTVMVGRLGADALASVALSGVLMGSLVSALYGAMEAIAPLVAQAVGAGRRAETGALLWQGVWLALGVGVPLTLACRAIGPLLALLGQDPAVVAGGATYIGARALGLVPDLVFQAHKAFLFGLGETAAVTRIVLVANGVNVLGNLVLIHGAGPIPALGVAGAGIASSLAGLVLGVLGVLTVRRARYAKHGLDARAPRRDLLRAILRLGFPIAGQAIVEVAAFATLAVVVGWLGSRALAAHQVALSLCGFGWVLADSVGIAATARVGEAYGARDLAGVQVSGRAALVLGVGAAALGGTVLLHFPEFLVGVYTSDPAVTARAMGLLPLVALLAVVDAGQIVAGACLRATSDSRSPFLAHAIGYWVLGMPLGLALGFGAGWGLPGVWIGLDTALAFAALALVTRFVRQGSSLSAPGARRQGMRPLANERASAPIV